jgi:diacylglycerol kinase (ATP)
LRDPSAALRKVFQSKDTKPIDVGKVVDASNRTEYWCNVLGIGFDAAINIHSRSVPILHGFWMYFGATLLTIVLRYERPRMELEIDGKKTVGGFLMLTLGNGTREGGGFRTTPDALMDDGWLDYLLVDPISRLRMLRLIPEVMQGTQGRFPEAHLGRFQKLSLKADMALPIEADGEMFAPYAANVREFSVEILPSALKVIV